MIYLIDDNQKRQQDAGWSDDKFKKYKEFIQPIYRLSEVTDNLRNELFKKENTVILFHESFFENFENKQVNDVNDIRNKLEKLSNTTSNRYYVIFSGSNSERKHNENNTSASIPVHILFNNLEIFIKQFQNGNEYNLKYLLYGTNPDIEPFLLEELNKSNRLFIEDSLNLTNEVNDYFLFRSKLDVNPFSENHTTIFNKDSEFGFHKIIDNSLNKIEYKGIFLPLCFGNSLSDFNGLRLATEIRCTNTINECTPIFIYSFIGIEYLLQNEYFNILKTKNVHLINYSKKAFNESTLFTNEPFLKEELQNEMRKLKLDIPGNYFDSHSIANIWGMYRLLELEGIGFKSISSLNIRRNDLNNLYFKYLQIINNSEKLVDASVEASRNEYRVILQGPKIIGKIILPESKKK
jgi:hypothetical protein